MVFKVGDRVAVTCSPIIVLSQYDRIRPSGVVSRELVEGVSIEDQIVELVEDARKAAILSLGVDLGLKTALERLVQTGVDPIVAMQDFCVREVGNVQILIKEDKKGSAAGTPTSKKPTRRT